MKILLLNTSEQIGGAAIACKRLMVSLNKHGVEAKLLVRDKQTNEPNINSINTNSYRKTINTIRFLFDCFIIFVYNGFSKINLFNISIALTGNKLYKNAELKSADVIHLHWINQGFLSIKGIKKIIKLGKPIVWTMHDQWAYTGICHYTSGCNKYENYCSTCHKLKYPKDKDLSYKLFNQKEKWYYNNNITLVGCSNWIANEAKKSNLCKHTSIVSIPNPINTILYSPKNKSEMRKIFNLPENKKLILFGACKVTDERKGFIYLKEAEKILLSNKFFSKEELCIVVFGSKSDEIASLLSYEVQNIGYIHNVDEMVSLYNAVDMFLIPSLEDNLPNTIMEAMACGTPCVGFNIGGIPEMIDHQQNGYIANYKNASDLANGIHWVLKLTNYDQLCYNARDKVENTYSEAIIAKKYIELYENILLNKNI
ncbi:MAG TPA: glycosyltransferase family 4 protein [Bacteroidales bacterium]|nr:glycosyltransferase family 4 protein [Bacteroidales bacterium]HON20366.1 glycosyltransferase family 4 protein [Bacteroidales bacterium]HOR82911.1 glycosyltransferase family 4 protein [Bacteroidales bacterium]HPJ92186.1 glycosyltransferase family 4 protein [Bacteroidales bacterium]HQB19877.1 glycosyltransferase family 4 protein [Bacteroidales bacterium]